MTCTDVAWLSGVLDSTDRLVGSVGQIAGPTAVYDRATLASVMALRPDDNVNEWLDEQVRDFLARFPLFLILFPRSYAHMSTHEARVSGEHC